MDILTLLTSLGINVSANVIYDISKHYFNQKILHTKEGLRDALISGLNIEGVDIKADKIIEFLAENGDITISGTSIYASDRIEMASSKGTSFSFGNDSTSKTDNTAIEAKGNSKIVGTGNAKIVQEDGSISFYT